MQCGTCNGDMEKRNEYESGNIRFQRWWCDSCRAEGNQALGLVGGMPED